jgi:uncharacterized protein
MKRAPILSALGAGALFGVGLAISGMCDPRVVQGFLDVLGLFNPALLFVLGGAVGATLIAFRFVLALPKPLFGNSFVVPTTQLIDRPLLLGSAIFGVGWGLAGYCPGPALVGLAAGFPEAWYFVPAMIVGGLLQKLFAKYRSASVR